MPTYVSPKPPRYTVAWMGGVEEIRIPARRNWLTLLFLPVWIVVWTVGGIAVLGSLFTHFDLFLAVWLLFWALGWVIAVATILWNLRGLEFIRVVGGDLEIGYRAAFLTKSWLYRGSEIRGLSAAQGLSLFERMAGFDFPMVFGRRMGSVKFSHGARTIHAASALDEAEGRLIVAWLATRLPPQATAP